jgi:hypothetical protein
MNKHQLNVAKKPKKKPEDHGDFLARKGELEGVFERGKAAAREDKLAIWSETVDWWQHGSPQPFGVFTGDQRATRRSRGTTTQLLTNNNPVPQHYMNTGTGGMEFGYDGGYDSGGYDSGGYEPPPEAGGTVNANAASAGGRSSQSRRPESSGKAMGNLFRLIVNGTPFTEVVREVNAKLALFVDRSSWSSIEDGVEQAYKFIDAALAQIGKGVSFSTINESMRMVSATAPGRTDGFTVDQLVSRNLIQYTTFYSCVDGHDVDEQKMSKCETCHKQRIIASYHFRFEDWLNHFWHDHRFAEHVLDGPIELESAQSARVDEVEEVETKLRLWSSPAMLALAGQVDLTRYAHIPVVIQLFIDGFEPTESTRSVWAVLVRVLNLPGDLANKYIFPICMLDGKSIDASAKPNFIDAQLRVVVKELQSFYRKSAGHRPGACLLPGESFQVYDASADEEKTVRVYLHCVSCDMKAMTYVVRHQEVPSEYVCHRCRCRGTILKTPGKNGAGRWSRVYSTFSNMVLWPLRTDAEARREFKKQALTVAGGCRQCDNGYIGTTVFAELAYFDVVHGFLICMMHQIHNAVLRCVSKSLGVAGWTGDTVHRFLFHTGEGKKWREASRQPYKDSGVPDDCGRDAESLMQLKLSDLNPMLERHALIKAGNKRQKVDRLVEHFKNHLAPVTPSDNPSGALGAADAADDGAPEGSDRVAFLTAQTAAELPDGDDDFADAVDGDDCAEIHDSEDDGDVFADAVEHDESAATGDVVGAINGDAINEEGINGLFDAAPSNRRNVYSHHTWNGLGSMGKWPHVARRQQADERSLRAAHTFVSSVRQTHSVFHAPSP